MEAETTQESANGCMFPDEDAMLAAQGFAISPEALVAKSKVVPCLLVSCFCFCFYFRGRGSPL